MTGRVSPQEEKDSTEGTFESSTAPSAPAAPVAEVASLTTATTMPSTTTTAETSTPSAPGDETATEGFTNKTHELIHGSVDDSEVLPVVGGDADEVAHAVSDDVHVASAVGTSDEVTERRGSGNDAADDAAVLPMEGDATVAANLDRSGDEKGSLKKNQTVG